MKSKVDFLTINRDGAVEVVVREGSRKWTAAVTASMGEARRVVQALTSSGGIELTEQARLQLEGKEAPYQVAC